MTSIKLVILLFASMLLAVPGTTAQIVLNEPGYPSSVIGTDSLKITTYSSSFPSLAAAAGGTWDMNTVTDSTAVFFETRVPGISPYQFADTNKYDFTTFNYRGCEQSSILSIGTFDYGVVIQKNKNSLTPVTLIPTDSLIIDSQFVLYSSPNTEIAFPATYKSVWSSAFRSDVTFDLSVASFGYNHDPGILSRYTTRKDSVTGWGKMRVKDASGNPSVYLNVLQVQTAITTTDSFFLDGLPFTNVLLTKLSLTQGATVNTYLQNYYRIGEITPLAKVTFSDGTYSQPVSATTHVQRLSAVSVPFLTKDVYARVFPNPVSGNLFWVEVPAFPGKCAYRLVNCMGAVIKSGMLETDNNVAELQIDRRMPDGLYYMYLENGSSVYRGLIEVKK